MSSPYVAIESGDDTLSYMVHVRDPKTGKSQYLQVSLTEDERKDVLRNVHVRDASGNGLLAFTYARRHALALVAEARGFTVDDVTRTPSLGTEGIKVFTKLRWH